jgi:hypothetical protein
VTATVAQLGARTLRKLGVAIVANAGRPCDGPTMTATEVAGLAVRQLGIVVPEADRPALTVTVTPDDMAARALRAVGVNPAGLVAANTGGVSGKAQIAQRTLFKLGIYDPSETPNGADQLAAEAKVAAVHDMLVTLDYVTWDVSSVPDWAVEMYVVMTANLLGPEFGKPSSAEAFEIGRNMLRVMALSGRYGQTLALAKVAAVHDALVAAAIVTWDLAHVPLAFSEDYVTMAAVLLAPVMGRPQTAPDRQADQAAWDAAEGRIRRAALIAGVQDRAVARVREVYGELNALGLVDYDLQAIPIAISDAMAGLTAATLGTDFGKDEAADALGARWARLKQVAMAGPAGQALAEQEIRAAFASLEARGRVRDSIYALPVWFEDPLTSLAAVSLAPQLGLKADPMWAVKAEMELVQIHSIPTNYETVRAVYF